MPYLPCHYLYMSFIYCTCWVPTISVLNPTIFPCYSNLLLRRRRWIGILRRGVLGYVLPRLPFLWCYGVFRYSILLRVILVFKDTIYVIIILYIHDIWLSVSTFGRMCGTINHGSRIWWVLGFGIKTGYDSMRATGFWHRNLVQTHGSLQIPRSVTHFEAIQKKDNSGPSHLTCMTYVRQVDPKWVTHMFRYSTYAFN
jgi:hypothetical protein